MRKALSIILAFCMLLSGCGAQKNEPVQPALDFRTLVMGAERCAYSAEVEVDFGQRVYRFTVDCSYLPEDGNAEISVTSPDTIAGITATVDGETAQIEFDGTSLELGTMAGGHLAPMQLPQLLGRAWTGDYIVSVAEGDDGWSATYQSGSDDAQFEIVTYFTAQNAPSAAEIYCDDVRVLTAKIDNFSVT